MNDRTQILIQEAAKSFDNHDDHQALQYLEEAIKEDLNNVEAHLMKGIIAYDMDAYDEARSAFELVVKLEPQHDAGLRYLAELYLNVDDDPDKALPLFKKVLSLNPEDPLSYYNVGVCYLHSGDIKEGIEMFQAALAMDPDDLETIELLKKINFGNLT